MLFKVLAAGCCCISSALAAYKELVYVLKDDNGNNTFTLAEADTRRPIPVTAFNVLGKPETLRECGYFAEEKTFTDEFQEMARDQAAYVNKLSKVFENQRRFLIILHAQIDHYEKFILGPKRLLKYKQYFSFYNQVTRDSIEAHYLEANMFIELPMKFLQDSLARLRIVYNTWSALRNDRLPASVKELPIKMQLLIGNYVYIYGKYRYGQYHQMRLQAQHLAYELKDIQQGAHKITPPRYIYNYESASEVIRRIQKNAEVIWKQFCVMQKKLEVAYLAMFHEWNALTKSTNDTPFYQDMFDADRDAIYMYKKFIRKDFWNCEYDRLSIEGDIERAKPNGCEIF